VLFDVCLVGEFNTVKPIHHKLLIATVMTITLSGCQTTEDTQNRSLGVGIGVVVGSITGAFTNAALGTAVSVATGLATVAVSNYQSKGVRATAEEQRIYGATRPITKPQVKLQKSRNTPTIVKVGWRVAVRTVYWLNLPPDQSTAPVAESWTIKGKGLSPVTLAPAQGEYESGKREASMDFAVPQGVEPGTYVIEHKVQTGSRSDTGTSIFIVRS